MTVPAALLFYGCLAIGSASAVDSTSSIAGIVRESQGGRLAAVLITARPIAGGKSISVVSDASGRYRLPDLETGRYRIEATRLGYTAAVQEIEVPAGTASLDLSLRSAPTTIERVPSSALLGLLPDGPQKREFILDCTGCHQFDLRTLASGVHTKTREEWLARINQMIGFAGAGTSFPVMSAEREAETTADWLARHLGSGVPLDSLPVPSIGPPGEGGVVIIEYDLPVPTDLPHDLMVAPGGEVIVTGMFTHQMYRLGPASGEFTMVPIPVPNANPRALDIDDAGRWWVLLGAPGRLARFDPAATAWESWELGMYPHSVMLDRKGRAWFNGHFTVAPELIGYVDAAGDTVVRREVPGKAMPGGGTTIPYGLRVGPDGTVWGTELAGNRLMRFDAETGDFRLYELPAAHSGPRRLDVAPDGIVWIPEYAGNRLARFDPKTERFTEYDLPIPDALPYVVRVDRSRGAVWIGTAAADAVLRFDPTTGRFEVYRTPTRGALTRHIDIDEETGAVWGAYSPGPAITPRIFQLRPLGHGQTATDRR